MSAYDIVKSHYDASDRGDLDGMLAVLADDAEWTEMAGSLCAGTFVGPDAIFENVFKVLDERFGGTFRCTIDELIDGGDTVIGLGRYAGTHQATGKTFTCRTAHVWRVADGKVVKFEQFADTAVMVRAAEA